MALTDPAGTPRAPRWLRPVTRAWWTSVVRGYRLEGHHVRLLTLAGEQWDRATAARESLAELGTTYDDRWGQPKERPEVGIERQAAALFAKLVRELKLDTTPKGEEYPRLPRLLQGGKR
jgi:phage terminase small subunit